ncbi:hypothetical protein LU640_25450 [Pseudomonas monteilii]|uniref:Uncharacterized protein n=1 Tax=Pseudomonas mosselii TaxID=78327 RepID=A0A7W2Q1B8_9PSED|nr:MULTISPECIES: hypothetical protein [Pseudomonas putida group]MBA6068390.1 hypothetical protein [Pseudomonas mosselii]MCE1020495.1 hypothetical protein [Pseudomonas monteilii]MCE1037937.1 hypothetical protein [Pseudomonas monteilii]MCE1089971.1 hypothetical protein [Pseudomonas monteilii]
MIYASVSGAVVAALAAGEKGSAKGQAWQKLYNPNEDEAGCLASLSSSGGGLDRAQVDYWLAARLHHTLIPRHWEVLNAKYSSTKARKLQGIAAIIPLIASPAPALFIHKAVTAWAIPKMKGAKRKGPESVMVEIPLEVDDSRREKLVSSAIAAGKSERARIEALDQELIILPDSFYNMNNWDPDAAPEPTRYRWRAGIKEKLDGMIKDALVEVRAILEAEKLLGKEAA